jgi:hypothetical protein
MYTELAENGHVQLNISDAAKRRDVRDTRQRVRLSSLVRHRREPVNG